MKRLAIITTHPIQYYAPIFKLLNVRNKIAVKVFYTWGNDAQGKYDPGFGKTISWDIPLLDGYNYTWVKNTAQQPGSNHFKGIINPDLISLVDEFNPDAVLVFGWAYQSHLKAIRYFKGKVLVLFRGDSTLLNNLSGFKNLARTIFLNWVYRNVDHAFYVGTNSKNYFLKFGLKEHQLSFAPHAVDNKRFAQAVPSEVNNIKRTLGIKPDDIVILFAGKLEKIKSPLLLLSAFLQLKQDNLHLIFVGDGELSGELKNMSRNTENVHFLGFKNQTLMPAMYQLCDVFCLPSVSETWGLAVNEAMACGKAILVSDKVGCAVDLVKPGENGDIFKSGDKNDLLNKLLKLTENKELLSRYGNHSRAIISQWTFEKTVVNIENYLNETL